jgi:hypothetical protein
MGYRSDVAYTIRFKDKGKMVMFMTEARAKGLQPALDECQINEDKMHINFYAESIKWYESYPEVQMHEALMQLVRDWCEGEDHVHVKDGGVAFQGTPYSLGLVYACMGEDLDDCSEEICGFGDWDWVKVERRIAADWL